MAGSENGLILASLALGRTDVTNTAVPMLDVIPTHEAERPGAGIAEFGKAFGRKLGAVFGGAKQRLGVSIVITNPGS